MGMSVESFVVNLTSFFTLTPEQGANTQVYLCAEEKLTKGAFYEEMKQKTNVPSYAKDLGKARALWEESERLGGVQFNFTLDSVPEVGGKDMSVEEVSDGESTEEGTEYEEETGKDSA